ncbi:GNAT family N-acetyltransferase [Zunongwangia endophytica]|uniref:GNAT family N-acetyltransferase n=1 Tax=Zunongwangia endophytica TaxID=1808945 RepID=A0ABV8H860_9FLAO|nr:GNAT family N-acetyltransferase [Zunongwangia endophytica]MDN3596054.1 GNAT family N-acetyltransferase [Zunongwangia endophytica]
MIKTALPEDLAEIKQLTERCAQAMISKGIYQWNENYPTKEKLANDIEKKELFKLLNEENELTGIIVLTPEMDDEYIPIEWLTENKNNLYIHRLATDPSFWGLGNGKILMDFAEEFARDHNYDSVRLDTFSQNKRNNRFYEARGYKRLGDIFFPEQSEHPFHCYELVL